MNEFRAQATIALKEAGYALSPSSQKAVIYGFFAGGDSAPFYIGSTRNRLDKREADHRSLVELGKHANRHFMNKYRKAGNGNVQCEVIATVREVDQFFAERDLIKWALDNGIRLTNRIYNGIDFDIVERSYEYQNYELTDAHIDYLLSDSFQNNLTAAGVIGRLAVETLRAVKQLIKAYPESVQNEYPRLFRAGDMVLADEV